MSIYIEDFLLQNFIINFCLIRFVQITTKTKASFFKLILSSLVGSVASIIVAIFINKPAIVNTLKLITATVMILLAFKQSFKQFIINFILLFAYTFTLGGAITNLSSTIYSTNYGIIFNTKINLYLISFIIVVLTYIFELVFKNMKTRLKINNYVYNISLTNKDKTMKINAYLDSGNLLNFEDKPIIVLDLDTYLKLTNKTLIDFYLEKTKTISTSTIAGNNTLKIFEIDKIEIYKNSKKLTYNKQLVAINTSKTFKNQNYKALLSPLLF